MHQKPTRSRERHAATTRLRRTEAMAAITMREHQTCPVWSLQDTTRSRNIDAKFQRDGEEKASLRTSALEAEEVRPNRAYEAKPTKGKIQGQYI